MSEVITVKVPAAPPKQVLSEQRICPTCGRRVRMSITSDGAGWEIWQGACGHRNDYRIAGSPN